LKIGTSLFSNSCLIDQTDNPKGLSIFICIVMEMPKARQINEEKGEHNERYASIRSIAKSNT